MRKSDEFCILAGSIDPSDIDAGDGPFEAIMLVTERSKGHNVLTMFSYLTIKVVKHGSALFEVGDVKKFTVLETEEDNTDRQRHSAVRHLPCVC